MISSRTNSISSNTSSSGLTDSSYASSQQSLNNFTNNINLIRQQNQNKPGFFSRFFMKKPLQQVQSNDILNMQLNKYNRNVQTAQYINGVNSQKVANEDLFQKYIGIYNQQKYSNSYVQNIINNVEKSYKNYHLQPGLDTYYDQIISLFIYNVHHFTNQSIEKESDYIYNIYNVHYENFKKAQMNRMGNTIEADYYGYKKDDGDRTKDYLDYKYYYFLYFILYRIVNNDKLIEHDNVAYNNKIVEIINIIQAIYAHIYKSHTLIISNIIKMQSIISQQQKGGLFGFFNNKNKNISTVQQYAKNIIVNLSVIKTIIIDKIAKELSEDIKINRIFYNPVLKTIKNNDNKLKAICYIILLKPHFEAILNSFTKLKELYFQKLKGGKKVKGVKGGKKQIKKSSKVMRF